MSITSITCWKPHENDLDKLVACDQDDPQVSKITIMVPGLASNLEFDSLVLAEHTRYAIEAAFKHGKKQAMTELRTLIGCKCKD